MHSTSYLAIIMLYYDNSMPHASHYSM
jgi:hypothetical protein